MSIPVILIFDVGKTNKKVLLFNEDYEVLHEESVQLDEIIDEDGFACEDIDVLTKWVWQKFSQFSALDDVKINGVNFSAYGASFVHLDDHYKPLTSLYNYLKPYPENLKKKFYDMYGGEKLIAMQTASPVLGSLNSGMQLYRLKYEQPKIYEQIKYSLHLPQWLSFIVSSRVASDITSVGCHTQLWDFEIHKYHRWVYEEEMRTKFPPIYRGDKIVHFNNDSRNIAVGIGLHDSSAALIPYLNLFHEPFILLSTGTWCISLNPFNDSLLTDDELKQDCLCYLTYEGKPVKASRLFAGYEHEQRVKQLGEHYNKAADYYKNVEYNNVLMEELRFQEKTKSPASNRKAGVSGFLERDLNDFKTYEAAYYQLVADIIEQQKNSTKLVLKETSVKKIFVDGGFSRNPVFMSMLANAFPEMKVYAATVAQASSLGAAMAIHPHWNRNPLPADMITLKYYPVTKNLVQ